VAERAGLRWLGLGETLLTDGGAQAAMRHLRTHPSLTGLDVGENQLTDESCEALAEVIAHAPALERLLLRGFLFEPRRIGDAGGVVLAPAPWPLATATVAGAVAFWVPVLVVEGL